MRHMLEHYVQVPIVSRVGKKTSNLTEIGHRIRDEIQTISLLLMFYLHRVSAVN